MLENSIRIDTGTKKFETVVPIIPLIGSLAKEKFCNVPGHPISKPFREVLLWFGPKQKMEEEEYVGDV